MSDPQEPRRWADDPRAPRAFAEAIRAARSAGPTPAQAEAVAKAAAASHPSLVSSASALRFVPVVGVAALAAALWGTRPGQTTRPAPRADATVRAVTTTPPSTPPTPPAPPAPAALAEPPVSPAPAAPPRAVPAARARPPRARCVEAQLSARVSEATRAVLAGAHARALSIADDDAARCPAARSAEDRERVAIEALTRLGRGDEARARLARFARAFPTSLYLRRLRAMVGSAAP